ncbi:MAG: hypothetical protein Q8M11_21505 [Sulfuritalea sp.]|jgi:hypothetical protein|nr:hypothetical protein [Sulfuritalea sp.]MDP1983562.1 hypothetical protein [Sulfuritalea sp.]
MKVIHVLYALLLTFLTGCATTSTKPKADRILGSWTFHETAMKKLVTLLFAVLALLGMSAQAAPAAKKRPVAAPVAVNDLTFILEAMWASGGPEYKDAVRAASHRYKEQMDSNCRTKTPFDVKAIASTYRVFTPAGMESVRDSWIRKQVATMACITVYRDGEKRAEKLKR